MSTPKRSKSRTADFHDLATVLRKSASGVGDKQLVTVELRVRRRVSRLEVPAGLVRRLAKLAASLDAKDAQAAASKEISTQDAARLLNVSRPFVVKLIEAGKLPSRKVGVRRRLREADVLEYRRRDVARQKRLIDQLARDAEELGLDY